MCWTRALFSCFHNGWRRKIVTLFAVTLSQNSGGKLWNQILMSWSLQRHTSPTRFHVLICCFSFLLASLDDQSPGSAVIFLKTWWMAWKCNSKYFQLLTVRVLLLDLSSLLLFSVVALMVYFCLCLPSPLMVRLSDTNEWSWLSLPLFPLFIFSLLNP